MRFLIPALAVLLSISSPAIAAPLDTKHIPADTKWLVHIDFDVLRESSLGQQLSQDLFAGRGAGAKFKRMQEELGIESTSDLHSVTLFDTRFQRHHGLMMIRADNLDLQLMTEKLKQKQSNLSVTEYHGHTLYSWTRAAGKKYEHEVTGCLYQSDTLLVSRDIDVLKRTIEVLDGTSESLSADSPLAGPTTPGTIMCVRSKGLVTHDLQFRSAFMRQSNRFAMSLGERDGQVHLHAELDAKSEAAAERFGKIVESFRGIGIARTSSDEASQQVFEGLSVTVNETLVEANWEMSPEDAQRMIAAMKKHRQQRYLRYRMRREKKAMEARAKREAEAAAKSQETAQQESSSKDNAE